jgi:NAD(P)-dependent dehydrogenase (short-subunit alcohol dehydrogenase family)
MLGADSMENPMDPGRSRAFAGRRVAITGASGSLGLALLRAFHGCGASLVALTTRVEPLELSTSDGTPIALEQVTWSCGHEAELRELFSQIDILVINHGVNVHGDRSATALERSLEVNALSSLRLLEFFAASQPVSPSAQPAKGPQPCREVWINTSEAEILPAVSPLYEISKRLVGQLLSLRALDLAGPELRIRRLVLGPFRSNLNPIGPMGAAFVAQAVLRLAAWDWGLIIVTPNPLTYVLFPLVVLARWTYLGLFSRPSSSFQAPTPSA